MSLSFVRKGFFFKLFVSLLITIFISFYQTPAYAISSLDACASQASCGAAFVNSAGARSALVNGSQATGRGFGASTLSNSGVTTSRSLSLRSVAGIFAVKAGAGTLLGLRLSEENADSLRDTAAQRFCEQNSDSTACERRVILAAHNGTRSVEDIRVSGEFLVVDVIRTTGREQTFNNHRPGVDFSIFDRFEAEQGSTGTNWDIVGVTGNTPAFEELSLEDRQTAVELLDDSEISVQFEGEDLLSQLGLSGSELEESEVTVELPSIVIAGGTAGAGVASIGGSPSVFTGSNFGTTSGNDTSGSGTNTGTGTGTGTTGGTNTDGSSGTSGGTTTIFEEQPDTDIAGSGGGGGNGVITGTDGQNQDDNNEDICVTNPDASECQIDFDLDIDIELTEPNPEIAVTQFSQVNFFQYAIDRFITEPKFPFDIFGNLPESGETANECPTIELLGYSKEVCAVNDGLALLKYPVWIAWFFKLVLSI